MRVQQFEAALRFSSEALLVWIEPLDDLLFRRIVRHRLPVSKGEDHHEGPVAAPIAVKSRSLYFDLEQATSFYLSLEHWVMILFEELQELFLIAPFHLVEVGDRDRFPCRPILCL